MKMLAFVACFATSLVFAQPTYQRLPVSVNGSNNVQWLKVADIDQNGIEDILVGSINDDKVVWIPMRSDNMQKAPITIAEFPTGNDLTGFDLGDINQDGLTDVVVAREDELLFYLNNCSGFPASPNGTITSSLAIASLSMTTSSDGTAHLGVVASDGLVAELYTIAPDLSYSHDLLSLPTLGAKQIELADTNEDGLLDVVTLQSNPADIYVHLNNGTGYDQILTNVNPYPFEKFEVVKEFEGALPILVAVEASSNTIHYILNEGNFFCQAFDTTTLPGAISSIDSYDLEGDGVDLWAVSMENANLGQVYIAENLAHFGTGDYTTEMVFSNDSKKLAIGNFDGNGLLYFAVLEGADFVSVNSDFTESEKKGRYCYHPVFSIQEMCS